MGSLGRVLLDRGVEELGEVRQGGARAGRQAAERGGRSAAGEGVGDLGRGWPCGGHAGDGERDGAAAVQVEDAAAGAAERELVLYRVAEEGRHRRRDEQ